MYTIQSIYIRLTRKKGKYNSASGNNVLFIYEKESSSDYLANKINVTFMESVFTCTGKTIVSSSDATELLMA